jgi:integrase
MSNPLHNNGVMKHLERLKKIMNLALDLEWLDKNPFARFKLRFDKFKKEYLSKDELERFQEKTMPSTGLEIVRDTFIFCCYTGLSYVDVKRLADSNLVRGIDGAYWIHTSRAKNKIPVRLPLLIPAMEILKKYQDSPRRTENQLLPVFSNQKVNSYLKEICNIVDIDKRITFHSARHTFATTVTLSNGVPIETVSKMLGHTKITTTQVYARVLEEKISSDMQYLQKKLIPNKYAPNDSQKSLRIAKVNRQVMQ